MDAKHYDETYYRGLQERLRRLLLSLDNRLPPGDRQLVEAFIGANECGLALETMADALAENWMRLDQPAIDEIASMAQTMGLPTALAGRLRPLATA